MSHQFAIRSFFVIALAWLAPTHVWAQPDAQATRGDERRLTSGESNDQRKMRAYAESFLNQHDKNKDGFLKKSDGEWDELKKEHLAADADGNGVIVIDELTNYFLSKSSKPDSTSTVATQSSGNRSGGGGTIRSGGTTNRAVPEEARQTYVVQFTEFRFKEAPESPLTTKDILQSFEQLRKDGRLEIIETVRLSALEQCEAMVQFGRSVAVTTGATALPNGRSNRQFQFRQVGTLVRVTAQPKQEKILLNVMYEASRLGPETKEDAPQDINQVTFNTTLMIEPGRPTLVGSDSADTSSLLLVTIE